MTFKSTNRIKYCVLKNTIPQLSFQCFLSSLFSSTHRINLIVLLIFTRYSLCFKVALNSKWYHKLSTTPNVTYPLQAVSRHYTAHSIATSFTCCTCNASFHSEMHKALLALFFGPFPSSV